MNPGGKMRRLMQALVTIVWWLPISTVVAQQGARAAQSAAVAPPDSTVLAVLRNALGSQAQLVESFCGLAAATPGMQFQIEGGKVSRRGQYNATEKFWPYEMLMDGVCTPSTSGASMLGVRQTPFVAVIQLRLTTDDFGDPLVQLSRTQGIPPSPVGWMRFDARRLARQMRAFHDREGRYTSSLTRLSHSLSPGVGDPIIVAEDYGWWAYLSHETAADTVCVIASGQANPLTAAQALDVECGPRASLVSRLGTSIPTTSVERPWPFGRPSAFDSTLAAQPDFWGVRGFPMAYLRIPTNPDHVWRYLGVEMGRARRTVQHADRTSGIIVADENFNFGMTKTWMYVAILGDSASAAETVLRMAVGMIVVVGDKSDLVPRSTRRVFEESVRNFKRDFPGTVEIGADHVPAIFRTSSVAGGGEAEMMRAAMRRVLEAIRDAQGNFIARYSRYSSEVAPLGVQMPEGVTVEQIRLVSGGWTAVVRHVGLPGTRCGIGVNAENPVDRSLGGSVSCGR